MQGENGKVGWRRERGTMGEREDGGGEGGWRGRGRMEGEREDGGGEGGWRGRGRMEGERKDGGRRKDGGGEGGRRGRGRMEGEREDGGGEGGWRGKDGGVEGRTEGEIPRKTLPAMSFTASKGQLRDHTLPCAHVPLPPFPLAAWSLTKWPLMVGGNKPSSMEGAAVISCVFEAVLLSETEIV